MGDDYKDGSIMQHLKDECRHDFVLKSCVTPGTSCCRYGVPYQNPNCGTSLLCIRSVYRYVHKKLFDIM